jgi:AraC family transcriptional regulator of adaptative response/methylated-DNA-[protein]-cysteine methyltransferase
MMMTIDRDDEARWQAVLTRDASHDGQFVYAVTTTGIYCRPTCVSRRPQRTHVRFFTMPSEAEAAGFRPCQRCQPQESADAMTTTINAIRAYIEAHLAEDLSLARLGERFALSPTHLQRIFKRSVGVSPRQYVAACRHAEMKRALRETGDITAAVYDAGYRSGSSWYANVRGKLGMTPSTYRKGGLGMQIAYDSVASPLGQMLVAATPDGVCAVSFGETEAEVRDALAQEYPQATITRDAASVATWVRELLAYLTNQGSLADIPLDIPASPFQQAVYGALRSIPPGSRSSYSMVARMIGQPQAARAVAQACAHNPVALVIPCHRVVHENGALAGYRWGDARKRYLLQHEGEPSQPALK